MDHLSYNGIGKCYVVCYLHVVVALHLETVVAHA